MEVLSYYLSRKFCQHTLGRKLPGRTWVKHASCATYVFPNTAFASSCYSRNNWTIFLMGIQLDIYNYLLEFLSIILLPSHFLLLVWYFLTDKLLYILSHTVVDSTVSWKDATNGRIQILEHGHATTEIGTHGWWYSIKIKLAGTVSPTSHKNKNSYKLLVQKNGNDYAATGSRPLCLSSGSGEGSRPRKETKTCQLLSSISCFPDKSNILTAKASPLTSSGDFPPPSARTVSLNRLPVSSMAYKQAFVISIDVEKCRDRKSVV